MKHVLGHLFRRATHKVGKSPLGEQHRRLRVYQHPAFEQPGNGRVRKSIGGSPKENARRRVGRGLHRETELGNEMRAAGKRSERTVALLRYAIHVNLGRIVNHVYAAGLHRGTLVAYDLEPLHVFLEPQRIARVAHRIVVVLRAVVVRPARAAHDDARKLGDEKERRIVEARVRIGIGLVDHLDVRSEVLRAPYRMGHDSGNFCRRLLEIAGSADADHRTRLSGKRPRHRLRGSTVDIHAPALADADADRRIDRVDCLAYFGGKLRERVARKFRERPPCRGVLVRRCAEQRGDFLCRQAAPRSACEFGKVQRAEAALHAVHAAVIRKGVVVLHEYHRRPRLAHARLDARAKRGGKLARQRA